MTPSFGNKHIINKIAMSVSVRDVCTPVLARFETKMRIEDALSAWETACTGNSSEPERWVCLVVKGGAVVGWITYSDIDPNSLSFDEDAYYVNQVMKQATSEVTVDGSMSLLVAAGLIGHGDEPWIVRVESEVVGVLYYSNLVALPFRLWGCVENTDEESVT